VYTQIVDRVGSASSLCGADAALRMVCENVYGATQSEVINPIRAHAWESNSVISHNKPKLHPYEYCVCYGSSSVWYRWDIVPYYYSLSYHCTWVHLWRVHHCTVMADLISGCVAASVCKSLLTPQSLQDGLQKALKNTSWWRREVYDSSMDRLK